MAYIVAGLLVYLQGRPEHGIPIVLVFFLLLRELTKTGTLPAWAHGIQIGIVAAISPLPAAFLAIYWVFSSALQENRQILLLLNISKCALASVLIWAGVTSLVYPESLAGLLINTLGSAEAYGKVSHLLPAFPRFNWGWFYSSWFTKDFFPGIGLFYVLSVAAAVYSSAKLFFSPGLILNKIVILICIATTFPGLWHIGFAHSPINYTFLCLFPALAAWSIKFVGDNYRRPHSFFFRKNKNALCFASILLFGLPALGYARLVALQPAVLTQGISYATALARLKALKASLQDGEVVLIDLYSNARSAVIFDGPPWRFRAFEEFLDGNLESLEREHGVFARYRLYLQEGDKPLPTIKGFEPLEVNFNSIPVEYFGAEISKTTPGYGYAIYERIKTSN